VAFEVDHVDDETNEGWTVLVVGRSRPASDLTVPGFVLPGSDRPGSDRPGSDRPGSDRSGPSWPTPPDRLIGITIDRLSGQRTVERVTSLS
jgi:hypothetical protein